MRAPQWHVGEENEKTLTETQFWILSGDVNVTANVPFVLTISEVKSPKKINSSAVAAPPRDL